MSRGRGRSIVTAAGAGTPALKGRNLNSLAFQRQVGGPLPPLIRPEGAVPFGDSPSVRDVAAA